MIPDDAGPVVDGTGVVGSRGTVFAGCARDDEHVVRAAEFPQCTVSEVIPADREGAVAEGGQVGLDRTVLPPCSSLDSGSRWWQRQCAVPGHAAVRVRTVICLGFGGNSVLTVVASRSSSRSRRTSAWRAAASPPMNGRHDASSVRRCRVAWVFHTLRRWVPVRTGRVTSMGHLGPAGGCFPRGVGRCRQRHRGVCCRAAREPPAGVDLLGVFPAGGLSGAELSG